MKRNMLATALFLSLGIYIWNNFNIFSIGLAICIVAIYCIWCLKNRNFLAVAICIISVICGFVAINVSSSKAMQEAKLFDGKEVKITGKVTEIFKTDYGEAAYVKHRYTNENGKEKFVKIKVYLNNKAISVKYGDVISFSANLKMPDGASGFGSYDKQMNLRSEGILLESSGEIKNISVSGTQISMFNIFDIAYCAREYICRRIDTLFSGDTAGIIKGIIAGVDDDISKETEDIFRTSGISHILVVSGMHVNILITISMIVLMMFKVTKGKASMIIQLLIIWFFTFITGAGISAIRAAAVVTLLYLGQFISREADPLNSLGVVATVALIINPETYFNLGFRLSFLSTGTILIFTNDIIEKFKITRGSLGEYAAVTAAAQFGIVPIISQSFGSIGIFGALANVIVCPVLTAITAIVIAALFLGSVPFIGDLLVIFAHLTIKGIMGIARFVAMLPHSVKDLGSISGIGAVIYVMYFAAVKLWFLKKKDIAAKCVGVTLVLLCAAVCVDTFFGHTHITFLDTGNSDCIIIENKFTSILIDGGGSDNYSVAESTVIPYMRKERIDKIDVAFMTHYHTDHAGGIAELIKAGRIKRVVIPAGIYKEDFEIATEAKKAGIPLHYVGNSDKIKIGDIYIEAYNTFDGIEENNGFVYFVSYGNSRICISGDVHKNGEKALLESGVNVKNDILKIPHHGSDTSGSEEFLKAVSPEYGIILRGDNKYPNEESARLYKNAGIKYFSTNDCGSIRITLSKSGKSKIRFGRNSFYELRNFKKTG